MTIGLTWSWGIMSFSIGMAGVVVVDGAGVGVVEAVDDDDDDNDDCGVGVVAVVDVVPVVVAVVVAVVAAAVTAVFCNPNIPCKPNGLL